jgi:hypothetical protein
MKNLAVIALATLLSGVAFGQGAGKVVDIRPEFRDMKPEQIAKIGADITRARAKLTKEADRTSFDSMRSSLGDISMARIGEEIVRNLNHPKLEASDGVALNSALASLKIATTDIESIKNAGERSRVKMALEGALVSQVKSLVDTSGAISNPEQFGEIALEIGQMAKKGQVNQAVKMANEVSKLARTVSARAGRYGESAQDAVVNTSYQKAVNQMAAETLGVTEDGLIPGTLVLALNPNAVVNANKDVVIRENGKERAFDAERDITGTQDAKARYLAKFKELWNEVIRCMGGRAGRRAA